MSIRSVRRLSQAKPAIEGAGVHLRRAFGFGNTSDFDPFLLLDDFRNDIPADYLAGFPWHPHRGIETITYVLAGSVEHGVSLGNRGEITAGDVQWMTAGSGIIHQEMPRAATSGSALLCAPLLTATATASKSKPAVPGTRGERSSRNIKLVHRTAARQGKLCSSLPCFPRRRFIDNVYQLEGRTRSHQIWCVLDPSKEGL